MKKLWIIAAAVLLLVMTAGCGKAEPSATADTATQAPTDAPYLDTQLNEPEWTLAEGSLQLEDQDNIYAESQDILYFAFITNYDGSQELRFRFNEETANMLKQQNPDNEYYITLDNAKIGYATLNDDCTEATIKQEDSIGSITYNASKIRGLSE